MLFFLVCVLCIFGLTFFIHTNKEKKNSMGKLKMTFDGKTCQTKAICVPKEYRGGGSKWADWKKEYDGENSATIYEMVLRSRGSANIKRSCQSASTVRCTKRTRGSEPAASTVRLEKSAMFAQRRVTVQKLNVLGKDVRENASETSKDGVKNGMHMRQVL